jgi:DNA-binding transcriptional ArsR family regulator
MNVMTEAAKLARVAAMVGDPARATMLAALIDGRALTAGELAYAARVTPQTASEHLGKLVDAGLLAPASRQGRHRYHRLASPQVAAMLEGIMFVAGQSAPALRLCTWRGTEALRDARTCYDHMAGRLGVGIADALQSRKYVVLTEDGGEVTTDGAAFLREIGVDLAQKGRPFCRPCLDWSERRPHLAGLIGARIARHCLEAGWVRRQQRGRTLTVTPSGSAAFATYFGLTMPTPAPTGHTMTARTAGPGRPGAKATRR